MSGEERAKNGKESSSIFELAKQLENRSVVPSSLRKGDKKKCADLFKSRGYSNADIAEILDVDEKTVQRYIKDQREENALAISSNFQKQIVGEIVRDWNMQYFRLLRLSYSEGMTSNEVMKAIYLAHQVEKDGIELLERLGYLTKARAIDDIKEALELEKKSDGNIKKYKTLFDILSKLSSSQQDKVREFINKRYDEVAVDAEKMAKGFLGEK